MGKFLNPELVLYHYGWPVTTVFLVVFKYLCYQIVWGFLLCVLLVWLFLFLFLSSSCFQKSISAFLADVSSWEGIHRNHATHPTVLKSSKVSMGAWPPLHSLICLTPPSFQGQQQLSLELPQIALLSNFPLIWGHDRGQQIPKSPIQLTSLRSAQEKRRIPGGWV